MGKNRGGGGFPGRSPIFTSHHRTSSGSSGSGSSWLWWRQAIHQVWRQQPKNTGEKRKSGSRPGPFFLDFMDQNRAWFSWDINVLIGTYINVPWNNQKENHGTNILGGFLLVSTAFHTWARILNICFAKNIFSSNFLAVKSTKKLMEFPWSCRLTKMLW